MKVVFICESKVSLLNTYIISNSMYQKEDQKIVLITNRFMDEEYIHYIDSLQYWDKVILVDAKESKKDINKVNKSFLNKEQPDIIHYFTIGHFTTSSLVNQAEENCKIICTEGSIANYDLARWSEETRIKFREEDIIPDYNKVSEVWLLEKRLYKGEIPKGRVIKDIKLDLFKEQSKMHLQRLNVLFKYKKELFCDRDIIIAPTYLSQDVRGFSYGWLAFLQESICKILASKRVVMKYHVTTGGNATDDNSLNYLTNYVIDNEIPLELFVLNAIINKEKKVFITSNSSAAVTTAIYIEKLDSQTIEIIDLIRIYQKNVCYYKDTYRWLLEHFEGVSQIYRKDIHLISEFKELCGLINDIDDASAIKCDELIKDFRERDYEESFVKFCVEKEQLVDKNKKAQLYSSILECLLILCNQKGNINNIICAKENSKIAIYGYGIIGKQLYSCLENKNVVLIDNYVSCQNDKVVTYKDFLDNKGYACDCIILTVYEAQIKKQRLYDMIKKDFMDSKVISLEELNTILCAGVQ